MAVGRWVRLDLLGSRSGLTWGSEIWSTGINMTASDNGGDFVPVIRQPLPSFNAQVESVVQDDGDLNIYWAWKGTSVFTTANQMTMATAAIAYWNSIRGMAPTDSLLEGVRITAFDQLGKAINGGNYFYLEPPQGGGSNATSQLPAQLSVVASLRSGARGQGGRGRMYLPLSGITLSNGAIQETARTNTMNATQTFLKALKNAGGQPSVVNRAKLQYSSIDRVAVGNYMDVQRKRRNNIDEDYKEVAI